MEIKGSPNVPPLGFERGFQKYPKLTVLRQTLNNLACCEENEGQRGHGSADHEGEERIHPCEEKRSKEASVHTAHSVGTAQRSENAQRCD